MEWQPIETAPTDKRILAWSKNGKQMVVFWVNEVNFWYVPGLTQLPYLYAPTHWMPLPAPPKS
jgi:hypothetical protein